MVADRQYDDEPLHGVPMTREVFESIIGNDAMILLAVQHLQLPLAEVYEGIL